MSRAQSIRFLIGFGGGVLSILAYMNVASGWLAIVSALFVFALSSLVSEAVFRRLASHEEQRQDLEDRVRNPPL